MQNAKRMVLVDEKLLDFNPILQHYQNKQDQQWNQPIEQSVKTSISNHIKSTLNDPTVPDDVKAKQYSHNLNRFLHTKRELPTETLPTTTTVDDLIKFEPIKREPTVDELLDLPLTKKVKRKKVGVTSTKRKLSVTPRVSTRTKKKPTKYVDIEWEQW